MPVSTDDYVAISDHLARYCWAVDEGDEEGWIALWAEDGVFTGIAPQPIIGHAALRQVVGMNQASGPGRTRHMVANLACDYQDGRDLVLARYYNFVTNWAADARMQVLAMSTVLLERRGAGESEGWLIRRNDSVVMPG